MQFNSWQFFIFFAAFYAVYLLLPHRKQNHLLLAGSWLFYSVWDWRFTFLLIFSTVVDYLCGLGLDKFESQKARKSLIVASLISNLGILGFFKYFNFFIDNMDKLLQGFGMNPAHFHLAIVLPVGVSFYTFQSLSYTLDVYRKQMKACRNFFEFATFISFFPQLVAGPIERAVTLLPYVQNPRVIKSEEVKIGCWLIFWGFWKKVFIADNLAKLVDANFAHTHSLTAPIYYVTLVAFSFQIYTDFSAYSDIARGLAKLLGFNLMRNFNMPYFATNPSDFWKRWHISLSTWLRDYLYIPLGGNRKGLANTYRNLFLTMLLGGLWHGASWNYLLWGAFHGGILSVFHFVSARFKFHVNKWLAMVTMYQFTLFGWLLFRATGSVSAEGIKRSGLQQISDFFTAFSHRFVLDAQFKQEAMLVLSCILPLILLELGKYLRNDHYFELKLPRFYSVAIKGFLLFLILRFGVQVGDSFIYFQF